VSDWSEGVFDGGKQEVAASNPLGGLLGSFMGGGMMPIPSLTGGAGGASGDSTTRGGSVGGAAFDNSGWNVTFGANSGIESSRSQTSALSQYLPYILAGAGFLLVWKFIKKQ
jgi:hypothetical protein